MRIGIVTTSYPRRTGDPAGAFVAGHVRWLARAGHEVDVVCAGPGDAVVDGIPVARTHGWGLVDGTGAPDRLARAPWRLAAAAPIAIALAAHTFARASRWDALVAHWLVPAGPIAAAAARGRPLLAIAHGSDVHLVARRGLADVALAPLVAARARLVFTAPHLRDRLAAATRTSSARRLIEAALVQPMGTDDDAPWPGPPAAPTVLFLGRLVPIKGVDVLLDAIARLHPAPRVLIAGDGPERGALEAQATRLGVDATFLGVVPTHARAALFARASLIVLPSRPIDGRDEGTPLVALEARAAGIPLIASAIGGVPAAMAGWAGARLVEPGNAGVLSDRIAAAIAAPRPAPTPWNGASWGVVGPKLQEHWCNPA